jgi:hypothetical protein
MFNKADLTIRKFSFIKLLSFSKKTSRILTAIAITIFVLVIIFLFTGRIFLEIFQWLLLPFPEKLPSKLFRRRVGT